MNIFKFIGKSPWGVLCLLLITGMYIVAGEAQAALQCYGCHGTVSPVDYRPVDASFRNPSSGGFQGNHRTHMGNSATVNSCVKCHPGSSTYNSAHRDGVIKISALVNNSPTTTQYPYDISFSNRTSAFPQTSSPAPGSCSSVNCHFEKTTPAWGDAPFTAPDDCDKCHSAPPSDGAHGKKHGLYYGSDTASCSRCHSDHLAESNKFAHATSAGKRALSIRFTRFPNNSTSGFYTGDVSYPAYLPSQSPARNGGCSNLYCHSDGRKDEFGQVGPANRIVTWSGATTQCYSCHKGLSTNPNPNLAPAQTSDSTFANCSTIFGHWSSSKGYCTPDLTMASNAHHRLVGQQWVRKYPCYYCHNATMNPDGTLKNLSNHLNKTVDIEMAPKWEIGNRPKPTYDPATKVCNNVYCHSDGTTDPEDIRPVAWTAPKTDCNACHGHPTGSCSNIGCHDGKVHEGDPVAGRIWTLPAKFGNLTSVFNNVTGYHWPLGQEWMGSLPMFPNEGPLSARPNSHPRHAQTDFTCDQCHAKTVLTAPNGSGCIYTPGCHTLGQVPPGGMGEVSHIDAAFHVDKIKSVYFKNVEASYDPDTRICSNTLCHPPGANPVWGSTVNSVTCLSCHGTSSGDVDDYNAFNGTQGKINKTQWEERGHGRGIYGAYTSAYPLSGNPAANFPGNPCWYCHDNSVLHKDSSNIYRLKMHSQYERRFEKECVYCHMEGTNVECLACHVGQTESLSPQATTGGILFKFKNTSTELRFTDHTYVANCIDGGASCHTNDSNTHKVNAGVWTPDMKRDVKNQYLMMGVCLQCHDDDSSNQCTSCHIAPESNPLKYSLGYDPGTGFIKPQKARASAGHFGYKHYRDFTDSGGWQKTYTSVKSPNFGTYSVAKGTWKGGKFCWDCHDPHGDSNIYMIQKKVATETDGWFGIPKTGKQKDVVFLGIGGADYVKKTGTIDGVCNVCHSPASDHYTSERGDGHNYPRRCTTCHEHRFADSHANKQDCDSCHENSKPIPKHTAFGLPRDCTKCHSGTVGRRMDIMGQMKANSHHVQGVEVNNKHCYACHWEATPDGLIDNLRHVGYNYKNYSSAKDGDVDLVIWQANGFRPTFYSSTSATTFLAKNMASDGPLQRGEVDKVTNHCLSCHSDQNNDTDPFQDCKTPRQYAWDLQSIASRYSQTGTTKYGKYNSATYTNTNKKDSLTKSFSAHGKASLNQGGFSATTGYDNAITNTRGGAYGVGCFDCHNSHGSKVVGTTSSYATFNGTNNGANLKETKKDMGGYANDYKASSSSTTINPYGAGAGQCFDCHNNAYAGSPVATGNIPWGYQTTFGATAPIMGYKDTKGFGQFSAKAFIKRYPFRAAKNTIVSSHLIPDSQRTASSVPPMLNYSTSLQNRINGLCTPCHDPHGVSTTIANKDYAVPLLKGTWLTSPYKDDNPQPLLGSSIYNNPIYWRIDRNTFSTNMYNNSNRIEEDDSKFAGLCMKCHKKSTLTNGTNKDGAFKSLDRVHETVQGWGANDEHSFACSKCHQPHTSGLPRLMQTNCLDYQHRGNAPSGGSPGKSPPRGGLWYGFPHAGSNNYLRCHGDGPQSEFADPHTGHPNHWLNWPSRYKWNSKTPWPVP